MLKSTLFACVVASLVVACVASETDEELASVEAAIGEPVPVERCPDLLNQTFWTPESCVKNGQLGTRDCTQVCDIYRSIRISPGFPPQITCGIDDSDCGPKSCGPCEVLEWQDPIPDPTPDPRP